jgi:hypothetical protein
MQFDTALCDALNFTITDVTCSVELSLDASRRFDVNSALPGMEFPNQSPIVLEGLFSGSSYFLAFLSFNCDVLFVSDLYCISSVRSRLYRDESILQTHLIAFESDQTQQLFSCHQKESPAASRDFISSNRRVSLHAVKMTLSDPKQIVLGPGNQMKPCDKL